MKATVLVLALTIITINASSSESISFLEAQDSAVNIEICPGSYPFSISRTRVNPEVLRPEDSMQLLLIGSNTETVIETKIRYTVTLNGNTLQTDYEDRHGHQMEPKAVNKVEMVRDIPKEVPKGKWKIIIEELDPQDKVNWCINVTFEF